LIGSQSIIQQTSSAKSTKTATSHRVGAENP